MTNQVVEFTVEAEEAGERLDKMVAARLPDVSRTIIQELIKQGKVLVNNTPNKAAYRVEEADAIRVKLPPVEVELPPQPQDIPLNVIYEDEAIAIINKPAGMVVHPADGNQDGTLVNALLARWQNLPNPEGDDTRSGIVHRLDKDTSGLILVALTEDALANLQQQFKDRTVEKHYLALTEQRPPNDKGRIEANIGRDTRQRKRMAVVRDGREAITEFFVREFYGDYALLDVHPLTGRTHQIRVHLAFIKCPIVGDTVYGFRKQRIKLDRFFLHAYRLSFNHPVNGERMEFEAPLPAELEKVLSKLPR